MSTTTTVISPERPPQHGPGGGAILYVRAPHESPAIGESLALAGLPVEVVSDAAAAIRAVRRQAFVLAVVHLADERGGVAVIRALRMQAPHLPIAGLPDPARPLAAAEAVRAGASELLTLPLEPHDVGAVVANALDHASVGLAPTDPPIPAARDAVVANSPAMRAAVDQVRAAAADARGVRPSLDEIPERLSRHAAAARSHEYLVAQVPRQQ